MRFFSLRWQDQCVVALTTMLVFSIIVGVVLTSRNELAVWLRRKIQILIAKLESLTEWLSDDEAFDPEWMDAENWGESRR